MKPKTHERLMRTRHQMQKFNAFVAGFKAILGREPTAKEYKYSDFSYSKNQDCFQQGIAVAGKIAKAEAAKDPEYWSKN